MTKPAAARPAPASIPGARGSPRGRLRRLLAAIGLLGLWLLLPATAGAEPPVILETEAQVDAFPTVVLQLAIQDGRQQPVGGLTAGQITVIEEGDEIRPASVAMLKESTTPLALMFAIDTSLSMADQGRLDEARAGVKELLDRLRPIDSAAVVRFDSTLGLAQPFTRDRIVLHQALDTLTPVGNRKLYDGAYLALAETAHVTGNRAVILLTGGDDIQSEATFGTVKNLATDTGVKVYVVGVGELAREDLLESLAKGSGARYYRAPRPADQPTVLRAAFNDFTSRYEVVYQSALRETPPGGRAVAQVQVVAPSGTTTAAVAYRVPRTGATITLQPRGPALREVPSRPRPPALPDQVIVNLGLVTGLGVLLSTLGLLFYQRRTDQDRRLRSFVAASMRARDEEEEGPSLLSLVAALLVRGVASVLIRLLPPHQVRQISRRLLLAGSPNNWRVSHFLTIKGIGLVLGLALGWLFGPTSPLLLALAAVGLAGLIGFLLPDAWLNARIRRRQRAILRALPNALDLLSISVQAGLSLDAAMLEVVHKWRNPLSEEFSTVLADLKVGKSRREALRGLAQRSEISEVTAFVSALVQADEIGLSIGRTLAVQAEQIRLRQRQRAERLAREASIKMLFPLALLIFPAIFVVVLVPALPTLMEALRSLTG